MLQFQQYSNITICCQLLLQLFWRLPSVTLRTPTLSYDLGATHLTLSRHKLVDQGRTRTYCKARSRSPCRHHPQWSGRILTVLAHCMEPAGGCTQGSSGIEKGRILNASTLRFTIMLPSATRDFYTVQRQHRANALDSINWYD